MLYNQGGFQSSHLAYTFVPIRNCANYYSSHEHKPLTGHGGGGLELKLVSDSTVTSNNTEAASPSARLGGSWRVGSSEAQSKR